MMREPLLQDIPTNLVMGFLGVGKTTAILNLLSQKPENETWAVLVNEFGKVGIDGAIYEAHGVAVKEIPGGCMCCAAGAPLQVGINKLLKSARPDRLLIEPTGIGHPHRVLETLKEEAFQSVLDLRASICLVDPRSLSDPRYTSNANFIDQISVSDVLIANKTDLAGEADMAAFEKMARGASPAKALIAETCNGRLKNDWLDSPRNPNRKTEHPQHHRHGHNPGLQSCGWMLPEATIFAYEKLARWLGGLSAQRVKGLLRTERGAMIINENQLTHIDAAIENRLEILAENPDCGELKRQLTALRL